MYLMHYLNEKGERVYTMQVRCWLLERTSLLFSRACTMPGRTPPRAKAHGVKQILSDNVRLILYFVRAEGGPGRVTHGIGAPRPLFAGRQVLAGTRDLQEALQPAAHPAARL